MLINRHIVNSYSKPLNGADSIDDALDRMGELGVLILPVVDSTTDKLIGQVGYEQLKNTINASRIADLELQEVLKVYSGQHIFEAARLMLQHEMQQIPVVDEERTFLGMIDKQQVFELLCKMLNLNIQGSVVTIQLNRIDFSLSEIVHLIETEDAKILGLVVETPDEDHQKIEVSIKLNLNNVSRITAALRRYGYLVFTDSTNQVFENDLENKADELLKYIDM